MADACRVRPDLQPAKGPDAAQPPKLRASTRCQTRQNGQNSNPESRSRWIKVGGNVRVHRQGGGSLQRNDGLIHIPLFAKHPADCRTGAAGWARIGIVGSTPNFF